MLRCIVQRGSLHVRLFARVRSAERKLCTSNACTLYGAAHSGMNVSGAAGLPCAKQRRRCAFPIEKYFMPALWYHTYVHHALHAQAHTHAHRHRHTRTRASASVCASTHVSKVWDSCLCCLSVTMQ